MEQPQIKYVVITPIRDEERFIEATILSTIHQTIRPTEWIIVDDGSTDGTPAIIDKYAHENPWIRVVHRPNRGFRKSGGGVVEAFNEGYATLGCHDWEYVVKLDGDLILDENYFEHCFAHFQKDERLGIGGGTVFYSFNGKEEIEQNPDFHVRGATKIYRRQCWEQIGGLWQAAGWDTIDESKAQMLGWRTQTFADVKLRHQRLTGTAESLWKDIIKGGRARYVAGYHPLFLLASCAYRLVQKPFFIGSVGLFWGYLSACLGSTQRVNDPALIRFVRREQMRRLMRW